MVNDTDDGGDGPAGLHARLLDALGPAIAAGEHPPGSVLRTDELAERFGVSRTVVREAVRVLESLHLVRSRRRVGVTVLPREEWDVFAPRVIRWRMAGADRPRQLRSLTTLRSAIEPVAAGLAASVATPEECAAVTRHAMDMVAAARGGDLEEYLVHDVAFHRAVLRASGNEMFARLDGVVREVLTARTRHHVMFDAPDPAAVTLHVRLAEAIRTGDPTAAERLTRDITEGALRELDILTP
ncbi:FadR/GntR family transcriptional regulator [Streptomyces sp. RFCAC02]|uniref:FadR/GntR family transcriptional regulator n=1 Tax=Streptomyces sp. RFCAC02 TaxID=2499143 RepID=UPI00101F6A52|nr:FadR/GntR family transcriptional regulator [Streptomyces sp. RFCAC02]